MKLYNSLSRQKEEFQPIKKNQVGLYTCGPTVYDNLTIGNLRTYIFEDTLRRALKLDGYTVKHVMNITDIEDKIIERAKKEYAGEPVAKSYKKLTTRFEQVFTNDVAQVGIDLTGSELVRATDEIPAMQTLIAKIPNRYIAEDGVYFNIGEFPDYGAFVKLDRSHEHHRIRNDEYGKEHVADFVLWKSKKDDEPAWPFELDGKNLEGRPGWHIECSAMSAKYLGQPFDIHTGGEDLKFPHHENEMAQSKAAHGKNLANYWLHGAHLLVDGQRMGKSLKNFYVLDDLVKKSIEPLAYRLLVLQAHYRKQLNFTWESLQAAQTFLQTLQQLADRQFQPSEGQTGDELDTRLQTCRSTIHEGLVDDLDTVRGISALADVADFVALTPLSQKDTVTLREFIEAVDSALGLGLANRKDIGPEQKQLIQDREAARHAKDYKKADEIRNHLEKQSIGLNDNDFGVTWYRLS